MGGPQMSETNSEEEIDVISDQDEPVAFSAQICANCEVVYGHRPTVCRECGSETFEDHNLSSQGRVYASTVIRVPGSDHQNQEPFSVALVDIGEDLSIRVTARLRSEKRPDPGTPVEYLGQGGGAFWFRLA